ncbi:uncharacterized protein LOC144034864 [Vanacampus margaritifer]
MGRLSCLKSPFLRMLNSASTAADFAVMLGLLKRGTIIPVQSDFCHPPSGVSLDLLIGRIGWFLCLNLFIWNADNFFSNFNIQAVPLADHLEAVCNIYPDKTWGQVCMFIPNLAQGGQIWEMALLRISEVHQFLRM